MFTNSIKLKSGDLLDYSQAVTSAKTCRRQTAHGIVEMLKQYPAGTRVLDFGGGKFDDAKQYAEQHGFVFEVYDPYNRTELHNLQVLSAEYDVLVCNNVLNVVTDDVIDHVIDDIKQVMLSTGAHTAYVTVYEKNRDGKGEMTDVDTYQRNEKTKDYCPRLETKFKTVTVKSKLIKLEL